MPYRVDIKNSAKSEIRKLPNDVRHRIVLRIAKLSENPRPPGVKKLEGSGDLYRVRVGDYRIIFQIDDYALVVLVVRVADRKDAYD
jgi:mRNA interferase RelE/StbE